MRDHATVDNGVGAISGAYMSFELVVIYSFGMPCSANGFLPVTTALRVEISQRSVK